MARFVIRATDTGVKFDLETTGGETIVTSEVYKAKAACRAGIRSVIKNVRMAGVEDQTQMDYERLRNPKFEIYEDQKGAFRFRLRAMNGQIIASGAPCSDQAACMQAIESIKKDAPIAPIIET
ncbi:MAG: YegP family protein [Clostridia bacterium]|nr:YegP family protein [Clostridia bacterium]